MKLLLKNIAYLSTVKGVDFIIPLVLIPIVIYNIGIQEYGYFSLYLFYFNFFISLADFGHSLIAIKKISSASNDSILVNNEINKTITFKLISSLLIASLWMIYTIISDISHIYVILIFSLALIFESLSLSFFFQAKENLKVISLIQLATRVLSSIFIIWLIKNKDDLLLYVFFHCLPNIINTILIYILYIKKYTYKIRFKFNIQSIKDGWHIYSYQMLNGLILPVTSSFISIQYGISNVAIFSICQRIVSSSYRIFEPAIIAIFPYLSRLKSQGNIIEFKKYTFWISISILISVIFLILAVNLFGSEIRIYISAGNHFTENQEYLYNIMSMLILPMVFNLFLTRIIIIMGYEKTLKIALFITFLSIIAQILIIYFLKLDVVYVGIALVIGYLMTTTTIICILFIGIIHEKKKNINVN